MEYRAQRRSTEKIGPEKMSTNRQKTESIEGTEKKAEHRGAKTVKDKQRKTDGESDRER